MAGPKALWIAAKMTSSPGGPVGGAGGGFAAGALSEGSVRVLRGLLVGGLGSLPRLGGEADLPCAGAVALTWDRVEGLLRAGAGVLPRGVDTGEFGSSSGLLAVVWTGPVSVGAGVPALALGVEPEAVRFLPAVAVGAGVVPAVPFMGVQWRPSLKAVSMKYLVPDNLASVAISVLWYSACLSNSWAFHCSHFSSTSAAAALVAFFVNSFFVWRYQSW